MISTARILAVVKKDVVWAKSNIKLISVMLLPLFVSLLFSFLDQDLTFPFSLIFVNAFIGVFSTSYLIIEEKNKGTLLALLTTPLTSHELLLAKFLYNLILCGTFSLFVLAINSKFDLIFNPVIWLYVILFAGTTCFVGFFLGLYFENEQEMSVFAPVVMLYFCIGGLFGRITQNKQLLTYFPDTFLSMGVGGKVTSWQMLSLVGVGGLLFFSTFLVASGYAKFYFSNNKEGKASKKILIQILLVLTGVIITNSGLVSMMQDAEKSRQGVVAIKHQGILFESNYHPQRMKVVPVIETEQKVIKSLVLNDKMKTKMILSIRKLMPDESDTNSRKEKMLNDKRRNILSFESLERSGHLFHQWSYINQSKYIYLIESICRDKIFQFFIEFKLKEMDRLGEVVSEYKAILQEMNFQCVAN